MGLIRPAFIAPKEVAGIEEVGIITYGIVFRRRHHEPGVGSASHAGGTTGRWRGPGNAQKDQEGEKNQENQKVEEDQKGRYPAIIFLIFR